MNKHQQLYDVAAEVRDWILEPFGDVSMNMCFDCAWDLAHKLKTLGFKGVSVIRGRFIVTKGSRTHKDIHYWVKAGDYVVDITADQWNIVSSIQMPKIFVSRKWSDKYEELEELAP